MAETVDHPSLVSVDDNTSSGCNGSCSSPPSPSGMGKKRPTVKNLGALSLSLTAAWTGVPKEDGDQQPSPASSVSSSRASSSPCTPLPRTPHFLDECRFCTRPLGRFFDIYMYKGDTPFCSEECRDEHIQFEEVKERSRARFAAAAREEKEKEQHMRVRMVVRAEAAVAVEVV